MLLMIGAICLLSFASCNPPGGNSSSNCASSCCTSPQSKPKQCNSKKSNRPNPSCCCCTGCNQNYGKGKCCSNCSGNAYSCCCMGGSNKGNKSGKYQNHNSKYDAKNTQAIPDKTFRHHRNSKKNNGKKGRSNKKAK